MTGEGAHSFRLRPLATGDLGPLTDLWVESWRKIFPQIDFDARRPWLAEHIETLCRGGASVLVAVSPDGSLAGFVTIDAVSGRLDQIAVAPRFWGSGAAEALLDGARRLSPGGITLAVNQDNARALRFYERNGFVRTGEGVNARSGLKTFELHWRPEGKSGAGRSLGHGR